MQISERFADTCSPVIATSLDTCGSVTRASIAHLTREQLNDLFTPNGLFADMDAWFLHSMEMKACGTPVVPLYDFIMANAERSVFKAAVNGDKIAGSKSLMHPFVFGLQKSVINKDHWKVTSGWANSGYTAESTGPLTADQKALGSATDRVIRIESRYSIPMDANWFRDRESIHIFNKDSGGITQHGQWKVLASASADDLTYADVLVRSVNAGSSEPFDPAPEDGVLIVGLNNVNDFEQWCQNLPTIDPRKKVPFWLQTFRNARCVDSEYRAVFKRLMESNVAFREFGDLDLAERNRQDEVEFQHRFVNDFFFNKPISVNQTLDLWESLEPIYSVSWAVIDPGLGGKLVGRRANFIGVIEQLRLCGRVKELAGNPLNFIEFLNINYDLMRARKGKNERKVTDIDWWTDSAYRAEMMTAFLKYYKAEYQDMVSINVQADQVNEQLGIVYDSYRVKFPAGVRINIMSHDYFDDWLDEFNHQDMGSAGRRLWALDFGKRGVGSIYYAQTATNRKQYSTAEIEQLARLDATFRCVMETISIDQSLYSETGTPVVECPLNSLVIQGIGDDPIVTTGVTGSTQVDMENLY